MSYTPGPWRIRKTTKMTITGNIHQVTDKDDYPTAFVPAWDEPQKGEEDGTEEAIANARLIAAAPDMLEALQILIGEKGLGLAFSDRILIARKAISKAEGISK